MVQLRKALVVLPDSFSDEVALVSSFHGFAIYRDETSTGSPRPVSAELGAPRPIRDLNRRGARRASSHEVGRQADIKQSLSQFCSQAGAAKSATDLTVHPSARVVVNTRTRKLEGVRVFDPARPDEAFKIATPHGVITPGGKLEEAAREAVAQVLADALVSAVWPTPIPSTGLLGDYDVLCEAAEFLLDPEELLLKMINAFVRALAFHAGFGHLAQLVGYLAEDLCRESLHSSPEDQAADDVVKIIDIDLYATDGQLSECTTLRELAISNVADVISEWLASPPGRSPTNTGPAGRRSAPPRNWSWNGSPPGGRSGTATGRTATRMAIRYPQGGRGPRPLSGRRTTRS